MLFLLRVTKQSLRGAGSPPHFGMANLRLRDCGRINGRDELRTWEKGFNGACVIKLLTRIRRVTGRNARKKDVWPKIFFWQADYKHRRSFPAPPCGCRSTSRLMDWGVRCLASVLCFDCTVRGTGCSPHFVIFANPLVARVCGICVFGVSVLGL